MGTDISYDCSCRNSSNGENEIKSNILTEITKDKTFKDEIKSNQIFNFFINKENFWQQYDDNDKIQKRFKTINALLSKRLIKIGKFVTKENFEYKIQIILKDHCRKPKKLGRNFDFQVNFPVNPIILNENSMYYGSWNINIQKSGYGIFITNANDYFEGNWKQNKLSGLGRYISSNGDFFEGNFLDNKPNGFGVLNSNSGIKYSGMWKNGLKEGSGVEIVEGVSRYQGEYLNGMKSGKGIIQWSDGSNYNGDFLDEKFHGKGIYQWNDGRIFVGDWKFGQMNGNGIYSWPDGKIYEGEYVNGKKEGFGKITLGNELYFEGYWKNGKIHGKGFIYNKGIIINAFWEKGKLVKYENETNSMKFDVFNNDEED